MISVENKVLNRIIHKGRRFSFTAKDFLDLGSRPSVDKALSSLVNAGTIRRLDRGLYDYPQFSELLGDLLSPDLDQVAHAIARKAGARIQASAAVAANLLGLTEQVPAKVEYLTDGLTRTVDVAGRTISFKRTGPKRLLANPTSGTVVQALLFLGRDAISDDVIARLRTRLSARERARLLKEARYATDWIADVARRVADEGGHG